MSWFTLVFNVALAVTLGFSAWVAAEAVIPLVVRILDL